MVNATFKNLMRWHTCFLSWLFTISVLPVLQGSPNIHPSSVHLLTFLLPTTISGCPGLCMLELNQKLTRGVTFRQMLPLPLPHLASLGMLLWPHMKDTLSVADFQLLNHTILRLAQSTNFSVNTSDAKSNADKRSRSPSDECCHCHCPTWPAWACHCGHT